MRRPSICLQEHDATHFPRSKLPPELLSELQSRYGVQYTIIPGTDGADEIVLNPQSQVGVVELRDGTTVEFRPKTPLATVFGMWEVATGVKIEFDWAHIADLERFDEVYSRLADAFVFRIRRLVTLGLYRTYENREENLRAMRGRLDLARHLKQSWNPALPCRFEEHEADNVHNRLILWALIVIYRSAGVAELTRTRAVSTVRQLVHSVEAKSYVAHDYTRQRYDRLNIHYQPLHALARFFVEHAGPSLPGSTVSKGVPFLVNMPQLYEAFVAQWLRKHLPKQYELEVHPSRDLGESGYRMVPDMVLYRTGPDKRAIAVLDTKYKTPERAAEADIYQATAYATEYQVRQAWLVYPRPLDQGSFVPVGTEVSVHFGLFRIDQDLETGGQEFLEQLGLTDNEQVRDLVGSLTLELGRFVETAHWVFARTYADTWPHHYIVKDRVDETLFLKLVRHIRRYGYEGRFYQAPITYFEHAGYVYWTMVPPEGSPKWYPPEEETIINRCRPEQTYEARLRAGTLPTRRSS
jgi:5-methylcytosine-specific restriction enzyme subunit McrC